MRIDEPYRQSPSNSSTELSAGLNTAVVDWTRCRGYGPHCHPDLTCHFKIPELDPSFYGFSDADQETIFNTSNTFFGKETMSLRELLNALRETYCGTIGAEYMYLTDQGKKRWWQQKLEGIRSKPNFTAEKKRHILEL